MHGTTHDQEKAVQELARSLYHQAAEHKPSIFESQDWLGKMIEWSLNDESLRVALFRFVDVLPSLDSAAEIGRHLGEYFAKVDHAFGGLVFLAQALHAGWLFAPLVKQNVTRLARRFIADEEPEILKSVLQGLRTEPAAFTLDVVGEALQQPEPQLGAGLLASAEHDRDLDLRPRLEEADDVTLLGLVVVGVDLGSQLLFLDDGLLLVLARLACLLSRLVLVLAVVHDLANRRFGVWSYFHKVEIGIRGDAESVFDAHNAYLLTTWSDQADFGYADALVDAGLSADGASYVVL